jgi:predicted RNA-binding Zn-ribbon protein involved in translation (DUF1610 family)
MKTLGKPLLLAFFVALVLSASSALAGETGEVSCTTPGCGYKQILNIGGTRRTAGLTGYCRPEKKFVRLKLKSFDEYQKPQACPDCSEPLEPIRRGSQISEFPCPKCGNMTLTYKLLLRKD